MTAETPDPTQQTPPPPPPDFSDRMKRFGEEAGAAGERLGREAQAAGERWSRDPGIQGAADTATRVWGLILLAVGVWFVADVTLGYDMPGVPWSQIWPLALVIAGVAVLVRAMSRRRA